MRIFELAIQFMGLLIIAYSYVTVLIGSQEDYQMVPANPLRIVLPKHYSTVNQLKDEDDLNYMDYDLRFGNYSDYLFQRFIGKGASGNAYLGKKISTGQNVVIKTFKAVRWSSIKREVKFMKDVEGHPNISPLLDIITNEKEVSLVYQRYVTVPTSQLFQTTNDQGNKFFMYQTLLALDHAHSRGIIHADMKPANIITNPMTKMLKLIDWGLSLYYVPGKGASPKVGTRIYKSPELLLDYRYYDYQTDIFSVGLMFSRMIFKKEDPFSNTKLPRNSDNTKHLERLAKTLGSQKLIEFANWLNMTVDPSFKMYTKRDFSSFKTSKNKEYCSDEALDLLEKMLTYNYTMRISAKEALQHRYFDSVRDLV